MFFDVNLLQKVLYRLILIVVIDKQGIFCLFLSEAKIYDSLDFFLLVLAH